MNERNLASYKAALTKHQNFLSKFKTFPQKTRKAIYAELLQLPLNHQHFVQLTKPYPLLPEHSIDKQVSFIVSAFCKLFPDLGNQWLPGLIHPFVRLFKEDAIASFQISLTFILNWFRPLFDDYPNSSKRIMAFFSKHLKKLEKKVNGFDYPLSAIIQPILLVALTDILNKQQTLQIYDFLVSHPFTPQLYLCILVVMVSKMQEKMLTLSSIQDIALQLRKEKKLNIEEVIKESLSLSKSEEEELSSIYSKVVFPLSTQRYPICQFIKKITPSTNKKLQESEQQQINRVQSKYEKLQKVVQKSLKENEVNYVEDINKKYSEAEGQMRQYLRQVKEEHGKKLTMIRNLENEYKQKINGHGRVKQLQYEKQLQAIERRGRVQRQIQLVRQEADSIREAERQVLHRLQELSLAKKSEIQSRNAQLRLQQRRL